MSGSSVTAAVAGVGPRRAVALGFSLRQAVTQGRDDLELMVEKFAVTGTDGLEVLLRHAEPGSRSARALETLGERPLP
ncbi:hypothetical protein B0I32_104493 [Nonomuraea fuscirosea]|uniref:Uncharacterized protein n=1 Tax=Nonomuraea fuscirosea TaxID=1291556 RepID=A0A2T0N5V8_9ACTN|nr:hypothetical protein B0I32_104493 [Nonomuraea fuscirosea]